MFSLSEKNQNIVYYKLTKYGLPDNTNTVYTRASQQTTTVAMSGRGRGGTDAPSTYGPLKKLYLKNLTKHKKLKEQRKQDMNDLVNERGRVRKRELKQEGELNSRNVRIEELEQKNAQLQAALQIAQQQNAQLQAALQIAQLQAGASAEFY